MPDRPSLAIQSVVYSNGVGAVERAARSLANACRRAADSGSIGLWRYTVGDCSPAPVLDEEQVTGFRSFVEAAGGALDYRFFGENLGSAGGHNRLATDGDEEVIMILNPDAVVAPDTVSVLVEALAADVGITEARQIPLEHPKEYDRSSGDTAWSSTACAATRRADFERLDGFDSDTFFLYCDDVDYSWRLRLAGLRAVYVPAARVFHDKRLTVTGDWPASAAEIYYSAEAALLLADKYSRLDLVDLLLPRFQSEGGAVASAAEEYLRRRDEGRLADRLDSENSVGAFVDGNYTSHRF